MIGEPSRWTLSGDRIGGVPVFALDSGQPAALGEEIRVREDWIAPGDLLWAQDAGGRWLKKVATSAVETAWPPKRHDFAGAYVSNDGESDGVFWPLESLRVRSDDG